MLSYLKNFPILSLCKKFRFGMKTINNSIRRIAVIKKSNFY